MKQHLTTVTKYKTVRALMHCHRVQISPQFKWPEHVIYLNFLYHWLLIMAMDDWLKKDVDSNLWYCGRSCVTRWVTPSARGWTSPGRFWGRVCRWRGPRWPRHPPSSTPPARSPQSKPQTFYPTSHPQSLYFFRIIPVQVWYLISVWTYHFMSFLDVVNFYLLDKQLLLFFSFYQEICVKLEKVN